MFVEMVAIRSMLLRATLLLGLSGLAACLYEDQIGKFDWKRTQIGRLKYAGFDSVKRIVVATEENVVASLSLKNGQVVWRQLLENGPDDRVELLHVDTEVVTVSGDGSTYYVRGWDLNTGMALYDWSLTVDGSRQSRWVVVVDLLIHVQPILGSHLEVTLYQLRNGGNKDSTVRVDMPWMTDLTECAMAEYFWTCKTDEDLIALDLTSDLRKMHRYSLRELIGEAPGKVTLHEVRHTEPAVLLRRNNVNRFTILGATANVMPYSLEANVISVPNGERGSLMQLNGASEIRSINLQSDESTTVALDTDRFAPQLVTGICRSNNCRVLFTSADNSISLLQMPSGKVQWTREEALGQVVACEFVELPLSERDASIEREFNEASSDVVSMFVSGDTVATDLIYHQIISGIRHGEYRCSSHFDIAALIAQQYYVENGLNMSASVLSSRIGEYIPTYLVQKENIDEWQNKIMQAYNKSSCVKNKKPPIKVKEDVVKYAMYSWPMLFSKFFEAIKISGPELSSDNVIIAVNWTGFFLVDDQEQILLELMFLEVSHVEYEHRPKAQLHNFVLETIAKERYVLQSPDAKSLHTLMATLLDGLRKRSIYLVAVQNYSHPSENPSFLSFKRGELVTLKNGLNGESIMTASWGYGECNGKSGDFPTEHVRILPTMQIPPPDVLSAFRKEGVFDRVRPVTTAQRLKMHTLAKYAEENFRVVRRTTERRTSVLPAARHVSQDELWKYTNEPMRQPLLESVLGDLELSNQAVEVFTAILKYAGDLPAPKPKQSNELTDVIFTPPLKNDLLKDEVYCQIMRQLTHNRLTWSEEKCWDLMFLATGSFSCSPSLTVELRKFLASRVHPVAEKCIERLTETAKVGPRKHPPYSIEVESAQHRAVEIFHKIYLPDDSDEVVEVNSLTTAGDVCRTLAARLRMASSDGFSLVLTVSDKAFSMPDDYFFYDFLIEVFNWIRKTKPSWNQAAPITAQYHVFFMKKLWINTVPGKDPTADSIFHYHQEVPKYLRGYHKCAIQDVIRLGALILLAKNGDPKSALSAVATSVKDVVPSNFVRSKSAAEWKRSITAALTDLGEISADEAKLRFLKTVYDWPTFGSAFFEVKQTSDRTYPDIVYIAINKQGVHVIHPQTKDILITYDFSELNNWSSGNTYFYLTVGNIMRKTKLLYETSQGYKMDDLLSSYADYFTKASKKEKTFNF